MPVLLPFLARFGSIDSLYIPGEELPSPLPRNPRESDVASLFVYRQRFHWPDCSEESVRIGVMGVLDAGACVLLHEETIPERVAAIRRSLGNGLHDPGPLWLWCNDPDDSLALTIQRHGAPEISVLDRLGCLHEYWTVTAPEEIEPVQAALSRRTLFLADGHHRYAAGWRFAVIQIRNSALRSLASHHRNAVRNREAAGALLVSAPPIASIEQDAVDGRLLPPKSTDFFPKLAAGIVLPHQTSVIATDPAERVSHPLRSSAGIVVSDSGYPRQR